MSRRLPRFLKPLFWEYDFQKLTWPESRHTVIGRVLSAGQWRHIQWLRRQVGDEELRTWIMERRGRMLTPRQLTYWQLVLDLPAKTVKAWLDSPERRIWDRRSTAGGGDERSP